MDTLNFSESAKQLKEKSVLLEEHREEIWKCVEFLLENIEMKKLLNAHLLKGELVVPAERTVGSLIYAVKDAVIKGEVVKGNLDRLDTIKGAQMPLREIKVISVNGAQQIEFTFTDFGKTHQGTKFTFTFENDSINVEKSYHIRFREASF